MCLFFGMIKEVKGLDILLHSFKAVVKENPDSQFTAMPQSITPLGMELNPITEHIDEPYSEKVQKMLIRKGVSFKKVEKKVEKDI